MRRLVAPELPELLRANPRFLLTELLDRGVTAFAYDLDRELFLLEHQGERRWLLGIESEALSWISWEMVHDKALSRKRLADAGLSVARGARFSFRELDAA